MLSEREAKERPSHRGLRIWLKAWNGAQTFPGGLPACKPTKNPKERNMRKIILTATTIAALAVPAIAPALASASPTQAAKAMAANGTAKDAIGFDVAAGNVNYQQPGGFDGLTSTGQQRSSLAGQPGAVADLISGARAATSSLDYQATVAPLLPIAS
jgi:hypothetical protein